MMRFSEHTDNANHRDAQNTFSHWIDFNCRAHDGKYRTHQNNA